MEDAIETAGVRGVPRTSEGAGCLRAGNRVDGVSPGRPQSVRYQRRSVNDCSPGRGGMAQDGGTRGETFHGEMDRCRESQGWTIARENHTHLACLLLPCVIFHRSSSTSR